MIIELCNVVHVSLQHRTRGNHALPVSLQVLVVLRYYAVGGFQDPFGQGHGIHKSTISMCIARVSAAICSHARDYIFSLEILKKEEELARSSTRCVVCHVSWGQSIDGTLIPIKAPVNDEHLYVCRKGFHALKIQVVADSDLMFRDIVVRYPGSAHDSYIWNNSAISAKFTNGDFGVIVGKSGTNVLP